MACGQPVEAWKGAQFSRLAVSGPFAAGRRSKRAAAGLGLECRHPYDCGHDAMSDPSTLDGRRGKVVASAALALDGVVADGGITINGDLSKI